MGKCVKTEVVNKIEKKGHQILIPSSSFSTGYKTLIK